MAGRDSRTDFDGTGLYHKRWHRLSKLSLACLFCFLSGSGLYLATRKAPSSQPEVASKSPSPSDSIQDPKILPASGILPPTPVAVVDRPQTISLPAVEILPVPGMENPIASTAPGDKKPAPVLPPGLSMATALVSDVEVQPRRELSHRLPIVQRLVWRISNRRSTCMRWATKDSRFEIRQIDENFFELVCFDRPANFRFPNRPQWVDLFASLADARRFALVFLPPLEPSNGNAS